MSKFESRLRSKNVTLVNANSILLECDHCHARWSPNIQEGGRMPRHFYGCPNECNWDWK